jgi:hypothetical protein
MRRFFLITAALMLFGNVRAQFKYRGFGIFGALTSGAHYYTNNLWEANNLDTSALALYPQSHHSKELLNWAAGAFAEFGGNRLRWQTELEYCNKGANEMEVVYPRTGARSGSYSPNKLTYFQWNNYAKYFFPLAFSQFYIMGGVRLEYLFRNSSTVFLPVSGDFPKFWFSGDLGAGYEVPIVKRFSAFVEAHWNPDVIKHDHNGGSVSVRSRTFELRIGLMMRPKRRSIDDCNAPVYKGPAY